MSTDAPSARRAARASVRRVAVAATGVALVLYLLTCVVTDLVLIAHIDASIDARLSARIAEVSAAIPAQGPVGAIGSYDPVVDADLDDAPVVLWWVRDGTTRPVPLETNAPALPAAALTVTSPVDLSVGGRELRVTGRTLPTGRLVAGTSAAVETTALSTLLTIEAALAPVLLVTLYLAAAVIGHRAAAPVERARQRQLEFTADASHELRTPLSVIEAEVGLALHAERAPDAYKHALQRVASESKRLRDIVEDLLWLARLDAVPAAPPDEPVALASLVAVCTARFAAVAAKREITITTRVPGEGTRGADRDSEAIVVAPAEWLDRLTSVLLDNACRYAPRGGRVDAAVDVVGESVVLTIDDNGPGIPEEQREQIFERFHRANVLPGGAGLGLSIANAVVQATGGSWLVDDSPLGGARVQVSWRR
jgi:signal transduction histidine kinase